MNTKLHAKMPVKLIVEYDRYGKRWAKLFRSATAARRFWLHKYAAGNNPHLRADK